MYSLHTDGHGFDVHRKVSSSSVAPNDTRHGRIVQKEISSEQFAMVQCIYIHTIGNTVLLIIFLYVAFTQVCTESSSHGSWTSSRYTLAVYILSCQSNSLSAVCIKKAHSYCVCFNVVILVFRSLFVGLCLL